MDILSILFAIAFAILGRSASTCQTGAIYTYEDASYRLESDGSSTLTCNLESTPESVIEFDTVSYDDYHSEVIITHTSYRVGGEFPESVKTTIISVVPID